MNLDPFLCVGSNEVGNGNRTLAYIQEACLPISMWFFDDCACSLLDDEYPYFDPETDGAPWYVADRPESAEFLGVLLDRMTLAPIAGRSITPVNSGGGVVGPMLFKPRTLNATGWMFASTCQGMQWGQRWLSDVLNGTCGGCAGDTAEILPSCPEDSEYDPDRFFRTMMQVGLTDGPTFTSGEDACYLQEVSFTIVAGQPYLYAPAISCLDEFTVESGDEECCLVETLEWNGDATLRVTISSPNGDATDIGFTLTPTMDGDCPTGPQGPCVEYVIPALGLYEVLTVDGTTRRTLLYDPTEKVNKSGYSAIDFDGMFEYPDVAPCSQFCACVSNGGATDVVVTVEQFNRES